MTDASAEDAESESEDVGTEKVSYTATSGVTASAVTVDDETDTADGAETPSDEVTSETTIAAAEGEVDGAYADDVTTEEYEITVPQYASSSSEDTYLDFTYTIYNGEAYITGYTGEETDIVIPDEIVVESDSGTETYPVTFIGWYAFNNNCTLTSVELPDSVTTIEEGAFSYCTALTEIILSDGVTTINNNAFSYCTALTEIVIPGSASSFGYDIFYGCSSLESAILCEGVTSVGNSMFGQCSSLTTIGLPESVTSIENGAFWNCISLVEVTLPDSLTSLGDYTFSYCTALEEIAIPGGVSTIGTSAFSGCTALTKITLHDGVTGIGSNAFYECSALTEVNLPEGIESIGSKAFGYCSNLEDIVIPESVTSLDTYAFYYCTSLTQITIPESITSLSKGMFQGCTALTEVNLPDTLTAIKEQVFDSCTSLAEILIPDNVKTIDGRAFYLCTSLSEIYLPTSLESIGDMAFYSCDSLTEITIPESVTSMGEEIFYFCEGLERVILCEGVTTVGNSMFEFCTSLTTVELPESVTSIGNYAFSCCASLAEINLPESLMSLGNGAFSTTALEEIAIPGGVTSIGSSAFAGCENLEKAVLCDGISGISDYMFNACTSLTELTIPETVTEIGEYSFSYCSSLEQITLPGAVTNLETGTFYNCIALTGVDLPENLSSIGDDAFYGCSSLTELCIPSSVESIAAYAFDDCDQLVLCVYPGSYAYEYAVSNSLAYKLLSDCTLTVEFDGIDGWSDYTGTLLVATSGSLKVSKRISAATSYVLTGLASGDECTVAVTNASGNVIASQTVELVKGENAVTFTELAAIADVCAHVYDADGNEVTDKVTVTWTEDGATYATGGSLAAVPVGTVLSCEVRLGKSLGLQYETPDAVTCTVTEEGTEVTVTLNTFSKITLTGTVLNESGEAISGAAVEMVQQLNGYSSSATALTGSDGSFTVTVCDADTQITVTAGGYRTVETELSAPSGNTDLGTVTLEKLAGPKISLQVSYQYAAKSEEAASTITLYSFDDVAFTIENQTTGSQVTEYSLSGQTLVLGDDIVSAGDELEITLASRSGDFDPVSATVTVGNDEKASASVALTQRGSISVTWTSVEDGTTGDGTVAGFVYDNTGKQVYKVTSSALKFDSGVLPEGTYTVILAGYSEDFVYPQSLSAWQSSGLTSWTDYLEETVTVSDGVVAELSFDEVPAFDAESFSYLDMTQSSFTSSKTSVTTGTYVTLRATAVLKEEYAEQATDFRWILELPENGSFLPGTLSISGQDNAEVYTEDNILEISVDDPSAVTRFCVLLTETGEANAAAYLEFTIDGVTYRQAVGTLAVTCTELDFTMSEKTNLTTVPVSGTGVRGATVRLYDNDTLVGQTEVSVSGIWSMTFDLYKPYTYTTHRIYAEITTKDGLTYRTETKKLIYQYGMILVSKVTMVNYGHEEFQTVFTFDGSQLGQSVSYDYNPDYPEFTFLIEFEGEDLSVLSNVQLAVACSNGESETLEAAYDETQGCYVATSEFYSSALPTGVTVWYDADQELILSSEEAEDEIATWEELAEILEAVADELSEYDEEEYKADDFSDNEEASAAQTIFISTMEKLNETASSFESQIESIIGDVTYTENGYSLSNDVFSYEVTNDVDISDMDLSGYEQNTSTDGDKVYSRGDGTEESPWEFISVPSEEGESATQTTMTIADGGTTEDLASSLSAAMDWMDVVYNDLASTLNDLQAAAASLSEYYEETVKALKEATSASETERLTNLKNALEKYKLGNWLKYTSKAVETFGTAVGIGMDTAEGISRLMDLDKISDRGGCSLRMKANSMKGAAVGHAVTKIAAGLAIGAVVSGIILSPFTAGLSIGAASLVIGVSLGGGALANCWVGNLLDARYEKNYSQLEADAENSAGGCDCGQSGCKCGCNCVVCPDGSTAGGKTKPGFNAISDNSSKGMIDPSGYIYEAVLSNRLEGVTTTIYQKETLYDMYDEPYEQITLWDAAEYGQENPLTTNSEGEYAWDVPEGLWRVVYEKEGYVTEQSDWMEVPPPQLDVNVGLVSYEAPVLEKVLAYTGSVEITFSKYMQTETLTAENITVKVNGTAMEGTFEMTNEEENPEDESETFTSVVTFIPNQAISEGATVTVEVSEAAASYAGTAFAGEAVSAEAVLQPESITAEGTVSVVSGESIEVTIQALPVEAVAGITVTVANQTSLLFTVEEAEVTLDAEGKATVHVTGCIAGESVILFTLGDTGLTAETVVSVSMATPSITRSEVSAGNIDASLITAIAGNRDAEQISFTGSYDLSGGLTLSAKSGVTGDKALLLQEDDSADSGLVLIDFCMIDSDGNITFTVEDAVDSVIVYGTNGDVTGDGVVNASDTLAILRGVSGRTTLDAVKEGFADVNLDGVVNSNDLLAVVKYVSGRTSSLN